MTVGSTDSTTYGTTLYELQYPSTITSTEANYYAGCYYYNATFQFGCTASHTWGTNICPFWQLYRITVDDANKKDFYRTDYNTAKTEAETLLENTGDELGEYSLSGETTTEELRAEVETLTSLFDDNATFDESTFCSQYTAIEKTTKSLNLPKTSRYLRISTAPKYTNSNLGGITRYLCSNTVTGTFNSNSKVVASFVSSKTDDNETTTIFLYYPNSDYNGKLCSYANGYYAYSNDGYFSFYTGVANNSNSSATNVGFQASLDEAGTYLVRFEVADATQITSTTNTRVLGQGTDYANAGAGAQSLFVSANAYQWADFQLEYVYSLPVTLQSDGFGSFECSVPVKLNEDCEGTEIYVAKLVDGTKLELHKADKSTIYASGTGFLIYGSANQKIHFDLKYDQTDNINSDYAGTFRTHRAAKAHETVSGYTTYVVATPATSNAAPAMRRVAAENDDEVKYNTLTQLSEGNEAVANTVLLDVNDNFKTASYTSFNVPLSDDPLMAYELDAGTLTGLREVQTADDTATDETIYDLQGRRIESPTATGIYLKNHKKIMIK